MVKSLRYRADGTLKIVQFTDLHWKNGEEADLRTAALMERVLEMENPDFVVFTGDTIESNGCVDPRQSFKKATAVVRERHIGWAAVFGNHDAEGGVTREELMEVQAECPYCFSQRGPAEISGVSNYVLPVIGRKGEAANALFFLDSGNYASCGLTGYDWIRRDQIGWAVEQSARLNKRHGHPLPSLFFFHIPLPEYNEVWKEATCYGERSEKVCCAPVNSGLFAALVEMGGVLSTFAGHDHVNDYWGTLHGIRLCYGRATGYNTYGKVGFLRGARVISLTEGSEQFETWLRLEDGSKLSLQKEHLPQQNHDEPTAETREGHSE